MATKKSVKTSPKKQEPKVFYAVTSKKLSIGDRLFLGTDPQVAWAEFITWDLTDDPTQKFDLYEIKKIGSVQQTLTIID